MEIKNKGVLITGGASGLGGACAQLLAQQGAKVAIADLNGELGEELAARLKAAGNTAIFVKTNVTEEESMQAAVRAAVEAFGSLHVLVNCAGIGLAERTLGKNGPSSLASFSRVIQINLIGTFNAIRLAAAAMARNEPN